ncbi:alkaline phosphatase [Cellulomonas sp. NS3]|uniref:alkaline phosphatase n=1 Tax=Cellulomonas sp. NS3 TaxID=2973977 RepID=UPI0021627214|nr:alkaline phosphatase [Cellulomonas sp. NS3]
MNRSTARTVAVTTAVAALAGVPVVVGAAPNVDDFVVGADEAAASARSLDDTGNMIFIHPDGTDAAYWDAGRIYWEGPDAISQWDLLPEMTIYRGHMADQLDGTSNGGATVHAFGFKVDGPGSFGTDSGAEDVLGGNVDPPRSIDALSGYPGSWLREAGNAGHPIGIINDGDIAEPGTGAFLAEVATRDDPNGIVAQIITGRPGFGDQDQDPVVVMGGGEENFLPAGTRYCTKAQIRRSERRAEPIPLTCLVHRPAGATLTAEVPRTGGTRTDGVNLLEVAAAEGYTVVRTRTQFERLRDGVASGKVDPAELKVLGLFADEDIFNDEPEESLIARGLVDPSVSVDAKETNLVLFGSEPGTPGYRPPTAAEMNELGLAVLQAHAERTGRPFGLVSEVESTDNFGNNNNGIGALTALNVANGVIGAARDFQADHPRTLILTAADSSGGAPQISGFNIDDEIPATVGSIPVNPTGAEAEGEDPPQNPLDGRYGRETAPFRAAPDQFGQELPFALAWTGGPDFNGGIVTRAQGLNAELLDTALFDRFDNVDVYRMAYLTLFGEALDHPTGRVAPTRSDAPAAVDPGLPGQDPTREGLAP